MYLPLSNAGFILCALATENAENFNLCCNNASQGVYCWAVGLFAGCASANTAFGGKSIGATCPGMGAVRPS